MNSSQSETGPPRLGIRTPESRGSLGPTLASHADFTPHLARRPFIARDIGGQGVRAPLRDIVHVIPRRYETRRQSSHRACRRTATRAHMLFASTSTWAALCYTTAQREGTNRQLTSGRIAARSSTTRWTTLSLERTRTRADVLSRFATLGTEGLPEMAPDGNTNSR